MQLSAPIYLLKRDAKRMARSTDMPLHQALDTVAKEQGFGSWSHLAAAHAEESPAKSVLARLAPGDLCLIGARPGQGKTMLGLDLASKAHHLGRRGIFFTLEYHAREVRDHLSSLGVDTESGTAMEIDTSDDISAEYITQRLGNKAANALIAIDYLQLLDQKRLNPSLQDQMDRLKDFVTDTDAICLVISQIDRSFDLDDRPFPEMSDIRLPNPLDLGLFTKVFFLHEGTIRMDQARG